MEKEITYSGIEFYILKVKNGFYKGCLTIDVNGAFIGTYRYSDGVLENINGADPVDEFLRKADHAAFADSLAQEFELA